MYYLAKLRFEVDQENGKIKKIREQHLFEGDSVEEVGKLATDRFASGISPCYVEGVQESKIMSVIEKE